MQSHRPSLLDVFVSYCRRTHRSLSSADIITPPQSGLNPRALHRRLRQTRKQIPTAITVSSHPSPSLEGLSLSVQRKASITSSDCTKVLPKHTLNISSAVIHPTIESRKSLHFKMQPKVIFSKRLTRPKTEIVDYSARSSLPLGVQSPSLSEFPRQRPYTAVPQTRDSVNRLRTIHVELSTQGKRERERGMSQFDEAVSAWENNFE